MAKIGLLTEGNARAVVAHVRKFGRKNPALNRNGRNGPATARRMVVIQAPAGGIPAFDGTTFGSAECEVIRRNAETNEVEPTGEMIEVWSMLKIVTLDLGERYGHAVFDRYGDWWVSVGDCSDT